MSSSNPIAASHLCPRCKSQLEKAVSFSGRPSEFWYRCSNKHCNTFVNAYKPQPHQLAFHTDCHRISGNFGGYGSGKTLTTREELYKHFFLTPNGTTIIGANVMSQYEQTLKRELESDIPREFVRYYSQQKSYMDLVNGHRIIYRPFDDAEKLRSYNVTCFVILEASEVTSNAFTQLKTRLRNMTASLPSPDDIDLNTGLPKVLYDWRKGIVESNPGTGWIRDELLLKSNDIYTHGTNYDDYKSLQLEQERDPALSTHITSTDANSYLPSDFIATISKNKPPYWVYRYVYGSFLYASGAIYPTASKTIYSHKTPPFSPEDFLHMKRIIAFDYGLRDPSVYLFGAIDLKRNKLYIYKELSVNEVDTRALSNLYYEGISDIPSGALITSLIIDPKSGSRRDFEKKSLADWFLDYNIATQPGVVSKDARIFRTNTYIESGTLCISDECTSLIDELRNYRWKPDEKSYTGFADRPEDGKDHSISCLEWICCWLPSDPKNLTYGVYDSMGNSLLKEQAKAEASPEYWALRDDDDIPSDNETPYEIKTYFGGFF